MACVDGVQLDPALKIASFRRRRKSWLADWQQICLTVKGCLASTVVAAS
jgi:hypothetical protein